MNVIEAAGLGKRYGKSWALADCSVAVPEGRLAALVGPNGAGKSTLMNMAVGLTVPTDGTVTVLGGRPAGSPAALDGIAFMAQDAPVYKNLSVADMLHLTHNLNRRFDVGYARTRLTDLNIPLKRKAGKLSGGQTAQVALTLALARRPRLLILDEPLSALDPLARQDFMATVMTAMADDGVSVLLSSHALAELERVADYLVVLGGGRPLAKVAIVGSLVTVAALILSQLFTWLFTPFLTTEQLTDLTPAVFDLEGLAYVSWVLTAFCLGTFLGALTRHVLPAMAATLVLFPALLGLTILCLRNQHLVTTYWPLQLLQSAWLLALCTLLTAATIHQVRHHAT